jgi:5'-deoxynucleotidase
VRVVAQDVAVLGGARLGLVRIAQDVFLPRPLGQAYASVLFPQQEESDLWHLVKAADKICAYVKCIEELKAGNQEFAKAERAIHKILLAYSDPEVHYFIDTFIPSFHLTLDELN